MERSKDWGPWGGRIFVNYRRDDSAPHALSVASYLENAFGKNSVFIDIDRMRAGQIFPAVLEGTLGQCKVMLAIIGPNWLNSSDENTGTRRLDSPQHWVRLEIERALARKVPVVPVLVGGAKLPAKSDLPNSSQPLVEHQCATLTTNGFRHEMAGLTHDIGEVVGRRSRGTMPAPIIALTVLSLAVVAYVGAYLVGIPVFWPGSNVSQLVEKAKEETAAVNRRLDDMQAAAKAEEERRRADDARRVGRLLRSARVHPNERHFNSGN